MLTCKTKRPLQRNCNGTWSKPHTCLPGAVDTHLRVGHHHHYAIVLSPHAPHPEYFRVESVAQECTNLVPPTYTHTEGESSYTKSRLGLIGSLRPMSDPVRGGSTSLVLPLCLQQTFAAAYFLSKRGPSRKRPMVPFGNASNRNRTFRFRCFTAPTPVVGREGFFWKTNVFLGLCQSVRHVRPCT